MQMYFSRTSPWLFLQSKGHERSLTTADKMKIMIVVVLTCGSVASVSKENPWIGA